MDWEWIPLGLMLVLVGSFYVGSLYLAFRYGMELGQRQPVAPRPSRAPIAVSPSIPVPPGTQQPEEAKPLPRRVSFQAAKKKLEAQ